MNTPYRHILSMPSHMYLSTSYLWAPSCTFSINSLDQYTIISSDKREAFLSKRRISALSHLLSVRFFIQLTCTIFSSDKREALLSKRRTAESTFQPGVGSKGNPLSSHFISICFSDAYSASSNCPYLP